MGDRIGFIGLGIMGKPMARNLLAAGFDLTVHSRSAGPVDELVAAGATRGSGPGRGRRSERRHDHDAARHARRRAGPHRRRAACSRARAPGSLVIDMSSIDPGADPRDGRSVRRARRRDARRAGQRRGARRDRRDAVDHGRWRRRRVRRARRRSSRRSGRTSCTSVRAGAGQVAKACNQLVVAATIEAVAEALLLAERSGVDAAEGARGAAGWVRGLEDPRGARPADARPDVRPGVPDPIAPQGCSHRGRGGRRDRFTDPVLRGCRRAAAAGGRRRRRRPRPQRALRRARRMLSG